MAYVSNTFIPIKSINVKYNQINCFSTQSTTYKDKNEKSHINKITFKKDWENDLRLKVDESHTYQSFNQADEEIQDKKYWETGQQLTSIPCFTNENKDVFSQSAVFTDSTSALKYWETDRQLRISHKLVEDNRKYDSSWSPELTHTDSSGKAKMVDIGQKDVTMRTAEAVGEIVLGENAFSLLKENKLKKGDVLTVSQIAGICGAKKTSNLIPLCHNIPLSEIDILFELNEAEHSVIIKSVAKSMGKTGVEMEALTAVSIAALTIYDMCKAVTKNIIIREIMLLSKTGGKSGDYKRCSA